VQDGAALKTVLLKESLRENSLDACMRHMEESTVAAYLADRFNADEEVRSLAHFLPMSFLRAEVIAVRDDDGELHCYCMEDLLRVNHRSATAARPSTLLTC
jgi:hypothetical protein